MKVPKGVLDAELALLVDRIPAGGGDAQEPTFLALKQEVLFLLRQQLLLEVHAMGRRDLPWQQKRALLRAMQTVGVSSLAALGELGDTKTIIEMVGTVAGIHSSGWVAHQRGPIKNGASLLHVAEALASHLFR